MKNLALLKNLPNFAVIFSLLLVAFELNQNQQSLVEGNNLARIQASNNAYATSSSARHERIRNIDTWAKGEANRELTEQEELIYLYLCQDLLYGLANLWEADYYSGNEDKKSQRLYIAERSYGRSNCYRKYTSFRENFVERGEIYSPLIDALDRGASKLAF